MTTFKYILRDTARLLTRHCFLGALTLVTTAAMMWILGITTLFSLNVQNLLQNLENDLIVSAYVKKDSDAALLADTVRTLDPVESLAVVSPQEAWTKLESRMGSQSRSFESLDLIEENPLPWSLEIRVSSASEVNHLVSTLMEMPDIDEVVYSGMLVERVAAMSRVASRAAVTMFVLSVLITSLVVYNTIHISLYSRQEEIGIMFLVGATRGYISSPFVLAGTFLALVGTLIAVLGITSAYLPGIRLLQASLPFLDGLVEDSRTIGYLGMLLAAFGTVLGWACSFIVVTRFMSAVTKPL